MVDHKDTVTTTPTPAPPSGATPDPVTKKVPEIAPSQSQSSIMRPLRYLSALIVGAGMGALHGLTNGARTGLMLGAMVGAGLFAAGAITSLVSAILVTAISGAAIGIVGGAAVGAFMGGGKELLLAERKDKYADNLLEKQQAKATTKHPSVHPVGRTKFEKKQVRRRQDAYYFDSLQAQIRENQGQIDNYWQNKVSESSSNSLDRGFW